MTAFGEMGSTWFVGPFYTLRIDPGGSCRPTLAGREIEVRSEGQSRTQNETQDRAADQIHRHGAGGQGAPRQVVDPTTDQTS